MPPRKRLSPYARAHPDAVLTKAEIAANAIVEAERERRRDDLVINRKRASVRDRVALKEAKDTERRTLEREKETRKAASRAEAEAVLMRRARAVPMESVLPMTEWADAPGMAAALGVLTGLPVTPVESSGKHMLAVSVLGGKVVSAEIHVTPGLPGEANVHELGHGKWTNFDALPKSLSEGIGQRVWNLIEDARVSRRAAEWFDKPVMDVEKADMAVTLGIHDLMGPEEAVWHEVGARVFGVKPKKHPFTSVTKAVTELGEEIDAAADSDDPREAIAATIRVLAYMDMLEKARLEEERKEREAREAEEKAKKEAVERLARVLNAIADKDEAEEAKPSDTDEAKPDDETEDADGQPDDAKEADPEGEAEEDEPGDGEGDVPDGAEAAEDEDEPDEGDGGDTDEEGEGDGDSPGDGDNADDVDGTGSGLAGNPVGPDKGEAKTPSPAGPAEVGKGGEAAPTLADLAEATSAEVDMAKAEYDTYEEAKEQAFAEAEAGSRYAFGRHLAPDNPLYHGHEVHGWPHVERDTVDNTLEDRMKLVLSGLPDDMDIPKRAYTGAVTSDVWKLNTGNAKVFARAPKSDSRLVMLVDMSGSMGSSTGGEYQRGEVLYSGTETSGYIAWQVVAAIEQQYPDVEVFGFWTSVLNHLIRLPKGKRPWWPSDHVDGDTRDRTTLTGGNGDCTALLWLREYLAGDMATTTAIVVSDGHPSGGATPCNEIEHAKAVAHQMRDDGIRYASVLIGQDDPFDIYPAELKTVIYNSDDFDKMKDLLAFLNSD